MPTGVSFADDLEFKMSVVKIPDGSGYTITVREVDGHLFPTFPTEVIRNVPHLQLRADDILISGYPKSGSLFTENVAGIYI